jgi:hypothetical protein
MPLFECSRCAMVDNTAMENNFWESQRDNSSPLCTTCYGPGHWHGKFPRLTVRESNAMPGAKPVEYTRANNWGRKP